MNVLVACEESQRVCTSFRDLGHTAWSCDIQPCSGGRPEWHILGDCLPIIGGDCTFTTEAGGVHTQSGPWDLIIAHPPCTYLTNGGAVRMRVNGQIVPERYANMEKAREFFLRLFDAPSPRVCVENPVPMKLCGLPPYTQIIEPWMFGEPWTKRTCLWLRGLPPLFPNRIVTDGVQPWVNGGNKDAHGNYRRFRGRCERDPKNRARTFWGIARAMAEQWGQK